MNPSEELKVLHLIHWNRSGITTLVRSICEKKGHSLILLENDNDFDSYYSCVPEKFCARGNILNLVMMINRIKPDVIQAHSFTPLLVSMLFFKRSKVIFHVHNEYPYFYNKDLKSILKRNILKIAHKTSRFRVVCVSQESGRAVKRITGSDFRIVVNGLPDQGKVRENFVNEKDRHRFYSVCRLNEQKNLVYAIRIIERLKNAGFSDVSYDIYGDGDMRDFLLSEIGSRGLDSNVRLKGYVDSPEELANNYDYYLSTSLYEGFGLSIADALRGNNIAIISKVGDLVRYLQNEKDAFFLTLNEDEDFAVLKNLFHLDDVEKSRVQLRAREKYLEFFTQEKMFSELESVYSSL
ncbi:MAG: glycosyltransferase family 4 protein [Pseudomonadota bacterium]|nr:glycosyltransferase family 4 protein [Pseudomonadota bacterium]